MIWPTIPEGVTPAVYFLCVGASVVLVGISKAGFGGGIGIVAFPLMAAVMSPRHMLGIMLPVLIAADILSNLHYLKAWEPRLLRPLLAGALVGIAVGSGVFWLLLKEDPSRVNQWLNLLIGAICIFFVALQVWGLSGRRVPTLPPGAASSVGVGAIAGVVSTLTHSSGPIVTLYLLQEKLEKRRLVGTLVFLFLIVNVAKVPTFAVLGTIHAGTLRDSIWFVPLLPVGTLLGAWMNRHIPEKPFAAIMYLAAALTAAHMIYKSL